MNATRSEKKKNRLPKQICKHEFEISFPSIDFFAYHHILHYYYRATVPLYYMYDENKRRIGANDNNGYVHLATKPNIM